MKQIFLLVFLSLYGICLYAQNDNQSKPYSTPFGTPFGKIISAKIDSRGGKLRSEDGGLVVIIPEGTMDTGTTIAIQSVHNELNENDEGAYQLEPSGIQFKKPLQLIFHFKNPNAELKSIAWQDAQGIWHRVKDAIIDTMQNTISCFASHFSRWSRFDKIYLSPNKARVKVNKTVSLTIISLDNIRDRLGDELSASSDDNSSEDDALLAAPHYPHYYSREWTVNGVVNGDNTVGTVTKQDNRHAIYKAPGATPQNNPVAVSVQIYSNNESRKLLLTSHIDVFDGWHYTFIGYSSKGCFRMIDSSSCDIRIQNNQVEVSNIINYKSWSDWPPSCDGCNWDWTNMETWKGLVEIWGAASSQYIGASENSPARINIALITANGNTPSAKVTCPNGDPRTIPSMPMPAMPNYILFDIISSENVVIHYGSKSGTNVLNSVVNGDGFIIKVTK